MNPTLSNFYVSLLLADGRTCDATVRAENESRAVGYMIQAIDLTIDHSVAIVARFVVATSAPVLS